MEITKELVGLAINMVRKNINPPLDKDDAVSYVLASMVTRDKRYNGKTPYEQYIIHHVKNDITDYLRLNLEGSRQSDRKAGESSGVSIDGMSESELAVTNDSKAFAIDSKRLISIIDDTAGFPLGTMLSQGYKGYEIAEKVGISRGRVSQIRKEIYGMYKTQNL